MSPHKRRWIVLPVVVVAVMVAWLVGLATRVPFSSDKLRMRVIETLSERLDAEVELGDMRLRIAPGLHAEGRNLVVRHRGRRDVPPLISIRKVIIDADLLGLWNKHVARVRLEGLEIQIPPGGLDGDSEDTRNRTSDETVATTGPDEPAPEIRLKPGPPAYADRDVESTLEREVVIDEVVADEATLTILRRNPEKQPRVWYMHELHVQLVGARTQMPFRTYLTNAVPPGQIETTGAFGPWDRENPGATPVEGAFTFENADLGAFKGLSGILSASGTYDGSLERIDVQGQTDTPEFKVNISGHTVPLKTKYHATVDGTNGNTTLEKIDATFLETSLVAKGGVYDVEGVQGRIVRLDVEIGSGRLEDVMRLGVKSAQPPMTGGLRLKTSLEVPPGDADVVDRLRLDGAFTIDEGRFASANVQQQINELSHRARGRHLDEPRSKVGSDFSGRFKLAAGTLTLSKLTFDVPGAVVELGGQYGLKSEALNFSGNLYMDAKMSQAMSGWKSMALRIVDPLFRKSGRTVIPIKITGTRDNPQFGLDAGRVF